MQTEFSLNQFAKKMRHPNVSTINKCKKVWVVGFREKKVQSSMQGHNHMQQLRDGPLHRDTVVADFLATFMMWLKLEIFDNVKWILP